MLDFDLVGALDSATSPPWYYLTYREGSSAPIQSGEIDISTVILKSSMDSANAPPSFSEIEEFTSSYSYNDFRRYPRVTKKNCSKYLAGFTSATLGQAGAASWCSRAGGVLEGLATIFPLSWDSSYFGLPMAGLHILINGDDPEKVFSTADYLLTQALSWTRSAGFKHLSLRIDVEEHSVIRALEQHGFRLMDTLITHAYDHRRAKIGGQASQYHVRSYSRDDYDTILEIADLCYRNYQSRFSLDPCLPRDLAQGFYREWSKNCCAGLLAEEILVAEKEEKIVGFLAYRRNPDLFRHTGIRVMGSGLAGFLPRHVRAYSDLLSEGIKRDPCVIGDFESQLTNFTVQRLWQPFNFSMVRAKHSFHCWLG